jgi:hypothetical protein
MESNKIEQLLEKYLNAETTLQEEATLKDYFTNGLVAPHLKEYQLLFGYFTESKSEKFTKTIQLNSKKTNWKWLSLAASVALLFSMYTGYEYDQSVKKEEAKIAYQNTQMAFELLTKNFNKGTAAIGYLGEFETTTNKVFKQSKK